MSKSEIRDTLMEEIKDRIDSITKLGFIVNLCVESRIHPGGEWQPQLTLYSYFHNSMAPGMVEHERALTWMPPFPTEPLRRQ
jgi:hypothetical protein